MMRFEDRLAAAIVAVLGAGLLGAGCDTGVTGGATTTDTAAPPVDTGTPELTCDGNLPPNYLLAEGYVQVEPGAPCPDPADAVLEINGCTFLDWQGITCDLTHEDANRVFVDDGYGGHFVDADAVPPQYGTAGPVVDVCYYTGIYWNDPAHDTTCGRPLLRDGAAVVALVASRGDWSGSGCAGAALGAEDRAAVGRYWLGCALLEHASVASFACFSLDLMRFGAPPELVSAAHRAALDEVEHARLCFGLASRYSGQPVGPGALDGAAMVPRSLEAVVEALAREGCIGETLAAVDAAARLAVATDPDVRAALEVIVRDEAEHAALAWRALRWFLERDADGALGRRVAAVLDDERERLDRPVTSEERPTSSARTHGLLSAAARARELQSAWERVIEPTWSSDQAARNAASASG